MHPRSFTSLLLLLALALSAPFPALARYGSAEHANAKRGLWVAPDTFALLPWFGQIDPRQMRYLPHLDTLIPLQSARLIPWCAASLDEQPTHYRITVIDPEGAVYFDSERIIWKVRHSLSTPRIELPEQQVLLVFQPEDARGSYTVTTEWYREDTLLWEKRLKLSLRTPRLEGGFADDAAFERWLHSYYKNPEPDRALTAYLFLAPLDFDSEAMDESYRLHILSTFFLSIFGDQPALLTMLREHFGKHSVEVDRRILYALGKLSKDPPEDFDPADPTLRSFWEWANIHPFIPLRHISAGIQLDVLWAEFFATAKVAPVRKIASCLEYRPIYLARARGEKLDANQQQQALLYELALWSLSENAKSHPWLLLYLSALSRAPETPEFTRAGLKEILNTFTSPTTPKS